MSKVAEQISDIKSDTLSRSISLFAEADDEEKSDEETEKTSLGQGHASTMKDMVSSEEI